MSCVYVPVFLLSDSILRWFRLSWSIVMDCCLAISRLILLSRAPNGGGSAHRLKYLCATAAAHRWEKKKRYEIGCFYAIRLELTFEGHFRRCISLKCICFYCIIIHMLINNRCSEQNVFCFKSYLKLLGWILSPLRCPVGIVFGVYFD